MATKIKPNQMTISKVFPEIPFAHRQPTHTGHCRWVHGHSWSIKVTFACDKFDENGFVIDFGRMTSLKDWIGNYLDHALVIASTDPALETFSDLQSKDLCKLHVVPDCSAEGLSAYIHSVFNNITRKMTGDRAWVVSVEVYEDSRNAALYTPKAG